MIIKHATLLKSLLLFMTFFVLQIVTVVAFHYLFPETPVSNLMALAIDISFVICVFAGFKYLRRDDFIVNSYNVSNSIFLVLLLLSFVWFLISPLFKIHQHQWNLDVSFTTHNLNEIAKNPNFFTVYGLLRLLLIVPILEELFYRKLILSSLLKKYGVYISIIVSSILFSIGHLDFNNSIIFLVYGILLGVTYWKTKSIYYPILLHIFINAMTFFLI